MSTHDLQNVAQALVTPGKGVLAADESFGTANQRLQKLGIPATEDTRRAYREMLFTTPGIGEFFSGVILFDETIRQSTSAGVPFTNVLIDVGIIPGIKVDQGTQPLTGSPGELITEGLHGLRDRIAEYVALGAQFAKWRAVLSIAADRPTRICIEANAQALARYAALCQAGGLVPIVEPEILMTGDHTLAQSLAVHEEVLTTTFSELRRHGVDCDRMILKPSMVTPGSECRETVSVAAVAQATVECLSNCVPPTVPGCAFLSGGQSDDLATAHLNAMNILFKDNLPWVLTFSYGRALQQAAMQIWQGQVANVTAAQAALYHRAQLNSQAALGQLPLPALST